MHSRSSIQVCKHAAHQWSNQSVPVTLAVLSTVCKKEKRSTIRTFMTKVRNNGRLKHLNGWKQIRKQISLSLDKQKCSHSYKKVIIFFGFKQQTTVLYLAVTPFRLGLARQISLVNDAKLGSTFISTTAKTLKQRPIVQVTALHARCTSTISHPTRCRHFPWPERKYANLHQRSKPLANIARMILHPSTKCDKHKS